MAESEQVGADMDAVAMLSLIKKGGWWAYTTRDREVVCSIEPDEFVPEGGVWSVTISREKPVRAALWQAGIRSDDMESFLDYAGDAGFKWRQLMWHREPTKAPSPREEGVVSFRILDGLALGVRNLDQDNTWVYFAQAGRGGPIKIGTSRGVGKRLKALADAMPHELRLLGTTIGDRSLEAKLHATFRALSLRGEWFSPSAELLDYIREHCDEPTDPWSPEGVDG